MNEPLWKTALCWGAVITFLTAPLVVFIMQEGGWLRATSEFKWLSMFYQYNTALVFGLSGLRTAERYIETKNGKPQK
jgi:hypothetical protein